MNETLLGFGAVRPFNFDDERSPVITYDDGSGDLSQPLDAHDPYGPTSEDYTISLIDHCRHEQAVARLQIEKPRRSAVAHQPRANASTATPTANSATIDVEAIARAVVALLPTAGTTATTDVDTITATTARPASKIAIALGVLAENPQWTDKRIADAAGCSPEYLSRHPLYRAARDALRDTGKIEMRRASRHRGANLDEYEDE